MNKLLPPAAGCVLALLFACAHVASSAPTPFTGGTWIDLTHPFDEDTIYWPTAQDFVLETEFHGHTEAGFFYDAKRYRASEHGGTHLDAPIHFAEGQQSVNEIPLERLMGPAIVVDVTAQASKDVDYQVTAADFENWEETNGRIPDGAIVLLNTGFAKHWPDAEKYLGTAEKGAEAVAKLHFPALHPDAASWLVANRGIAAIGLDTASIDYGQSTLFQSHQILFRQNIPAFENVAALDSLPATGAYVIAMPMKIKGGSGAPLRILAWVP